MQKRSLGLTGFLEVLAISGCSRSFSLEDADVTRYIPEVNEYRHEHQSIVTMRDRWPIGVPLQIQVQCPNHFMDRTNWRRLVVTPEIPVATPVQLTVHPFTVMVRMAQLPWSPGLHEVGAMPTDAHEVRFLVEAQETADDAFGDQDADKPAIEWSTIRSTTLVRSITQVPTVDDVVIPVVSSDLTRLISDQLALEFDDARTELGWLLPPKALAYEIRNMTTPPAQHDRDAVAGISIALRIRFLEHGAEVAFARFFIASVGSYTGAPVEGDLDRLRQGLANPDGWTVVIESDSEMALVDIANDRYWSGKFERPLSTVKITPKPEPW